MFDIFRLRYICLHLQISTCIGLNVPANDLRGTLALLVNNHSVCIQGIFKGVKLFSVKEICRWVVVKIMDIWQLEYSSGSTAVSVALQQPSLNLHIHV